MNLQDQVVNLELSKKLYEAGVRAESAFYWVEGLEIAEYPEDGDSYESWLQDDSLELVNKERAEVAINIKDSGDYDDVDSVHYYPAYSVAELGEVLPPLIVSYRRGGRGKEKVDTGYSCTSWAKIAAPTQLAHTEADARAKMLLHLISSGVIEVAK